MKQTRTEKIKAGEIWQVYPDSNPDDIRFEGSATACLDFIRKNYGSRAYVKGEIRRGKLLWEENP